MQPRDLTLRPVTSPAPIYRYRDGVCAVELLIVAITELDLFTLLADEPLELPTLCERLTIHERPADVMATLLVAMGFLQRDSDRIGLTPRAREHLVRGSPWYLGPYYASLRQRPGCRSMLEVLRTDRPASWGEREWVKSMEDESFADAFSAEMDCRGVVLGPAVARALALEPFTRLLDIGGGSGVYACALVAEHPHLEATVLEQRPVDRVARRSIDAKGYGDRVSVVAADMFTDPWPQGCDVHLFSNVIHDWREARVRQLLARSHDALPRGGLVAVHDAHLDAEKTGPLPVAEYSAFIMHFTEGRCYSVREIESLLAESGFVGSEVIPTTAARSVVLARKP